MFDGLFTPPVLLTPERAEKLIRLAWADGFRTGLVAGLLLGVFVGIVVARLLRDGPKESSRVA